MMNMVQVKNVVTFLGFISAVHSFGAMEQRYYNATKNPNILCLKCQPGTYLVEECTEHLQSSKCNVCPVGMFNQDYNRATQCSYCNTECPSFSLVAASQCTATSEIVCSCPSGHFDRNAYVDSTEYPHGAHSVCDPFSVCPKGYWFSKEGDATTDTDCKRCSPGVTFSDRASQDNCQNCSTCFPNEQTIHKCNVTHDTVCEHNQSSDSDTIVIIVSVSVPVIVFIIVFGIWFCVWKNRRFRPEKKQDEEIALSKNDHKVAAIEADEAHSRRNSSDSIDQQHSDDPSTSQANNKETCLKSMYEKMCSFIEINGYLDKPQIRQIYLKFDVDAENHLRKIYNNDAYKSVAREFRRCMDFDHSDGSITA